MPRHSHNLMIAFMACLAAVLMVFTPAQAASPTPRDHAGYLDAGAHVFLRDEITAVTVTMEPADLQSLLDDPWRDGYRRCSVRFVNSALDTTVTDVGIRVRGNMSRGAHKKSWKLSFNTFVDGGRFHGLKKMNLNGEHNEPTITRSHVAWTLVNRMMVPGSRTAHVRLVINDGALVDGVLINVEQIDDLFVDAWFGNRDGNLYKCLFDGSKADLAYVPPGDGDAYRWRGEGRTYVEKNNDTADHEDLAEFIDFINNSDDAEFAAGIARRLNVDNFLRAMAADVVLGHWDDYWYGSNNYYLYHNTDTDRFEYIPYDLDNTLGVDFFGIDWSERPYEGWGDGGYGGRHGRLPPLIRRLLANPVFERRLRRYVLEAAQRHCAHGRWDDELDAVRLRLRPWAFTGSYADGRMDNGITAEIFDRSFDHPADYVEGHDGWNYGLKPYLTDRAAYLATTVVRPAPLPPLSVTEFMADNESGLRDETGTCEDWIEIRNAGPAPIDLGGHHLTDDLNDPFKWTFPDTVLGGGEYLIVWCDGEPGDGPLHARFKLDKDGEAIGLTGPLADGAPLIDHHVFGPQASDVSCGRRSVDRSDWTTFVGPTPRAENHTSPTKRAP